MVIGANIMKPNELCKKYDVEGVPELSEITGQGERTLFNWAKNKPDLFLVVILGAQAHKNLQLRGLL